MAMFGIEDDIASLDLKSRLLLQVHDELVLEGFEGEWDVVEKLVVYRMENAATLSAPLDVQVGKRQNGRSCSCFVLGNDVGNTRLIGASPPHVVCA
ncbi:DNA polymerase [Alpinimonas psychrophila]